MRPLAAAGAIPLMILPVAAYNLLVATVGGGMRSSIAHERITAPLFELRTAPGGVWPVSAADLLIAAALVALFVVCLVELLLAAACATSTFFLITLMVLLDVLAGFILHIAPAEPR